jgi:hypothetical protein
MSIYVDGSSDWTEGDSPLDEAAEQYIERITEDAQQIISIHKSYLTIDEQPTIRVSIRYLCQKRGEKVEDYFLIKGWAFYTIALSADAVKYEEYKIILERMAKTFRVSGLPCK